MGKVGRTKRVWRLEALVAVLIVVVAAVLVTLLVRGNSGGTGQASGQQAESSRQSAGAGKNGPLDSLAEREPGDPLARGRVDAPVVMVAFEDFRCPFCAKFSTDTAPKLIDKYVETGVLRIEWRDYPIFGEQSMLAAKAGRAAARQGKFWEFHDTVFSHAPSSGHPELPLSKLVKYAREAGVEDIGQFKKDIHDKDIADAVRADQSLAMSLGIRATPAFVINGQPISGAQPLDTFVQAIERAKKQAK